MEENSNRGQNNLGRHDFLIPVSSFKEKILPVSSFQQQ